MTTNSTPCARSSAGCGGRARNWFSLFNSQEPQPATNHRQRARARALLAAAAITGLVQLGPRMLTEAEVRTQQRAPLPRAASFDTAVAFKGWSQHCLVFRSLVDHAGARLGCPSRAFCVGGR